MKEKIAICIVTLGASAILLLQYCWLKNMYTLYREEIIKQVLSSYNLSIELELGIRSTPQYNGQKFEFTAKEMIPAEELHKYKGDTIRLTDAVNQSIGKNFAEIFSQTCQSLLITQGKLINIHNLDSIYTKEIQKRGIQTQHMFILYNHKGNYINSSQDTSSFIIDRNTFITQKPIGIKNAQTLKMMVKLSPNIILDKMQDILFLSLILATIITSCLLYQLTIIKKKDQLLIQRTNAINGIIHDLKSPLAAIHSVIQYLLLEENNTIKQELLKNGKVRIERLTKSIDSLLYITKSSRLKIVPNRTDVNINELLDTIIGDMKICFHDKKFSIKIDNRLSTPTIKVDEVGINSLFLNLIENSLKYSDDNVMINIFISQSHKTINISISDNGWGIAPKDQKKIFSLFYQVSKNNKGYGIGLAYIRKIIKAHKGSIKLTSQKGKGTTFFISLSN
ncbi:HAMP domain-containing histidine kinase [Bacteroides fragilis]|uniref:sensor histidine kinase n=2 Tax=Bacteroides TaxID=816 RepID=UPI00202E67B4|nr:HAMP domain-containing sensor histidine kinase [Bacteroides fragilis]MCE8583244.1 HAMP domain-containing histidine kinase [Bacteroides fragilis]MCE8605116.1 HAMP domain-containing histidine kinase [Bacteroides fragilis]MCE8608934.1 HAMP domain-containing histidine kinase [Bacteroides fragilis]MCE8667782.1 HAMP domain-containing histidine kinase [Bacteroides fragilis]MCE8671021.1 HAMP domain-containing histidine kinase [Bacteroides fragilis]